jgi:hypothetical protein
VGKTNTAQATGLGSLQDMSRLRTIQQVNDGLHGDDESFAQWLGVTMDDALTDRLTAQ